MLAFPSNGIAAEPAYDQSIEELTTRLENAAMSYDVTMEDIKFSRSVGDVGNVGITTTSCTASATIGLPTEAGIELSAMAPTCAHTVRMLEEGIAEYVTQ